MLYFVAICKGMVSVLAAYVVGNRALVISKVTINPSQYLLADILQLPFFSPQLFLEGFGIEKIMNYIHVLT